MSSFDGKEDDLIPVDAPVTGACWSCAARRGERGTGDMCKPCQRAVRDKAEADAHLRTSDSSWCDHVDPQSDTPSKLWIRRKGRS